MEVDFDSKAIRIAAAIAGNLVGYLLLGYLSHGNVEFVLTILTIINCTVILWRKLDKVEKRLTQEETTSNT